MSTNPFGISVPTPEPTTTTERRETNARVGDERGEASIREKYIQELLMNIALKAMDRQQSRGR
jgi:hypothetical protein